MFKIVITETRCEVKLTGGDWKVVDQELKAAEEGMFMHLQKDEPRLRTVDVYGYTPMIEKEVVVTRELLTQELETLDLPAVIRAINNL